MKEEVAEKDNLKEELDDSTQIQENYDSSHDNGSRLNDMDNDSTKEKAPGDENGSFESGRRCSTRLRGKRPKMTEIITTSDEDNLESEDEFFERKEKVRKRGRKSSSAKSTSRQSEQQTTTAVKERRTLKSSDPAFSSGSFVVSKSDFRASMTPPIWKIDGKALLQKYTHFDQDGQTLYKSTSTYSGWTMNSKEQFYPAAVEIKHQNRKETVVKFLRGTVIEDESD